MLTKRLLVIDVETTGLDPKNDSIVQIASCLLRKGDLHEEKSFSSLVRPESPMSVTAQRVHGLSEEALKRAPPLDAVIREFTAYAPTDALICGHNVSFDISFLKAAYVRSNLPFQFDYHALDIWSIAFFILSAEGIQLRSYNLNALCGLFGIKRDLHHDALEDVRASGTILKYLFAAVRRRDLGAVGQTNLFTQP